MRKDEFKVTYCYLSALRLWDEGFIATEEYNNSRSTFEWEMWQGYHGLSATEIQREYSWIIKNERPISSSVVKLELEKRGVNL